MENGDKIYGGGGNDAVFAGGGDDLIYGGVGNDHLQGNGGNDALDGGPGNDVVKGGDGADSLVGGNDKDTLSGGSGNDTIDSFAEVFDQGRNDSIYSTALDLVYGDAVTDTLVGYATNNYTDTLYGGGGTDSLSGGGGNDQSCTAAMGLTVWWAAQAMTSCSVVWVRTACQAGQGPTFVSSITLTMR